MDVYQTLRVLGKSETLNLPRFRQFCLAHDRGGPGATVTGALGVWMTLVVRRYHNNDLHLQYWKKEVNGKSGKNSRIDNLTNLNSTRLKPSNQ